MDLARRARVGGLGLTGVATVVVAWILLRTVTTGLAESLPAPWAVAARLPDLLGDTAFLTGLGDTMTAWVLTMLVASGLGVVIGLVAGVIPALRGPVALAVDTFRSVPSTALIPIAILLYGLGTPMKLAVAAYAIVWPILINTTYGVLGVEPMRVDAARSMRLSWWRTQWHVTLPTALPSILTGIRIASGTALVVLISTELLGARGGVGTVLVSYQQAGQSDVVLAGTLLIGALGVLLYSALVRVERSLVKWAPVD
ncbi:ABC transporter permease [Cryptosporangium sp. NPDC048952]|uniref:ABC transporter permease n=1 Tax=Cryptosporangium sp. NPDC048952 TaxID=3363961 RepID=UPI003710757B